MMAEGETSEQKLDNGDGPTSVEKKAENGDRMSEDGRSRSSTSRQTSDDDDGSKSPTSQKSHNSNNNNQEDLATSDDEPMEVDVTSDNKAGGIFGTPQAKSNGGSLDSPRTPSTPSSSSKKRKRLTPDERQSREKERAEKRAKLEEEKVKKDEEKRKREQERLEKLKAKELERVEKERQREQERVERERQKELERLEKEKQKEQERLKREEKERQKELERLEKEKQKEQERLKREEELAKKNEEKRKKEEEKRKKDEEKEKERLKLEEKKAKQANLFTKFFNKSPATTKVKTLTVESAVQVQSSPTKDGDKESDKENLDSNDKTEEDSSSSDRMKLDDEDSNDVEVILVKKTEAPRFSPMPFQIKSNMAIAPLLRRTPLSEQERKFVDTLFLTAETESSCEEPIRNQCRLEWVERAKRKEMRKTGRTKLEEEAEEEVKIVMEDVVQPGCRRYRMKLLQFNENRRPAYWGTWKRQPVKVNGLMPLAKEEDIEYDFDSDDEWEDEPEDGEEIENSDGEEEIEDPAEGEPVDEEDEEGWMVPHGYLSDNEGDGEHMDLDIIKTKEKEFFRSLKEQVKMGIPVIQSEGLAEFRMIFPPKVNITMRRSYRKPKKASKDVINQSKGFLAAELPSDDEDDRDWNENVMEEDTATTDKTQEGEESSSDSSSEEDEESEDISDSEVDEINEDESMEVDDTDLSIETKPESASEEDVGSRVESQA